MVFSHLKWSIPCFAAGIWPPCSVSLVFLILMCMAIFWSSKIRCRGRSCLFQFSQFSSPTLVNPPVDHFSLAYPSLLLPILLSRCPLLPGLSGQFRHAARHQQCSYYPLIIILLHIYFYSYLVRCIKFFCFVLFSCFLFAIVYAFWSWFPFSLCYQYFPLLLIFPDFPAVTYSSKYI